MGGSATFHVKFVRRRGGTTGELPELCRRGLSWHRAAGPLKRQERERHGQKSNPEDQGPSYAQVPRAMQDTPITHRR